MPVDHHQPILARGGGEVRQALAAHPPSFTIMRANQRLTIPTLCVVILLFAAPARAYTTPWMHPEDTEFDDGWGLLDPSIWSDPNEWERQPALTGGWAVCASSSTATVSISPACT
jgi:hypothetical protein